MADENAARFEQMEQTTQELKEMLLKNQEEHREQMANLMEMVLQLTKGKATTESPIPTEIAIGSGIIQEEPFCPPGSIPTHMQPSFTKYYSTSYTNNSRDMSNTFTTCRGIHISSCDSINRASA